MDFKLPKMQKVVEANTYIIKKDTMAILPWYTKNADLYSYVLERFEVKNIAQKPQKIIERSCEYYLSDYSGRVKAAAKILKGKRMLPVLISESNKMCMVPLGSPSKPECIWLSLQHVVTTIAKGARTIVIFSNNQKLELDIERGLLEAKLNQAARLMHTYELRQERINDYYKGQFLAEEENLYLSEDEEEEEED